MFQSSPLIGGGTQLLTPNFLSLPQAYSAKVTKTEKSNQNVNYLPLANMGVNVFGYGNDIFLHVKEADKLLDLLKAGKFVGDYGGKKIYSINFHGNQYFKSTSVALQKAEFLKHTKTLKVFKAAGVVGTVVSLAPSTLEVIEKKDAKSAFGLGMDLLLVGATIMVGGVPALVIGGAALAIGAYEYKTGKDVSDMLYDSMPGGIDKLKDTALHLFSK